MPIYFEMSSHQTPLKNRANADAIAEILQDALDPLNVRVVSIGADAKGYVFACAARQRPRRGRIVDILREDPRLKRFEFSAEAESSDGPFAPA